ncbi:MAG: acylphosphatase [Verrucomicrobia bacterium]|nr:acylphosphatase [Verrucomicrobiota bacterium]
MKSIFQRKRSLKKQLHVIFKGEVQGVGFRATCRRIAHRLNLTGFARNLPGGDVELLAQGEKAAIVEMLRELSSTFTITENEESYSDISKDYDGFFIL